MTDRQIKTFMKMAISLAKKGKGKTAPNPCVGAILTQDGQVVAKGYHRKYGRAHAEVEAITDAKKKGIDTSKCSLFVTLEPCNHYGKTPPCTKAILEAKIKEVYIGTLDPNPKVNGGGAQFLQQQGVKVIYPILEKECQNLIRDFYCWTIQKRPFFYLKLASTIDGKIATSTGASNWISCEKSRRLVHKLRSKVNGVLIGGGTLRKDNPKLTVRLKHTSSTPKAIILTKHLPSNPIQYYLGSKRPQETIFFALQTKDNQKTINSFQNLGIKTILVPEKDNFLDLDKVASWLFQNQYYYILIEGGGFIAQSFFFNHLVDEFWLFLAPKIMGDQAGISSFWGRKANSIQDCLSLKLKKHRKVDQDLLLIFQPRD
ncbi:bifunctional diaminohydroxyphosphoribosylaminopyrimidine deaminase/5-amino-6-(5-phosphoribosylamino)uracil reductase RibD [Desulfonauticus submarinus]